VPTVASAFVCTVYGPYFGPRDDGTRVGLDQIGEARVSTVFLGLDHGFGGPPLWVEALGVVDEQIAKIKGAADGG